MKEKPLYVMTVGGMYRPAPWLQLRQMKKRLLYAMIVGGLAAAGMIGFFVAHALPRAVSTNKGSQAVKPDSDKLPAEQEKGTASAIGYSISRSDADSGEKRLPEIPAIPSELMDSGFDAFVDLRLMGDAWARLDVELMIDAALRMAEGERVLLRPHKANIPAEKLLAMTIELAAIKKDQASLNRLAKVADSLGNKALSDQAASALKLAQASREVHPALMASVESMNPDTFALYRGYVQDIQAARLARDCRPLDQIDKELPLLEDLSARQRASLKQLSKEARLMLPKDRREVNGMAICLDKLANASRGWPNLGHVAAPHFRTPPLRPPHHNPFPLLPKNVHVYTGGQGNGDGRTEVGGPSGQQFIRRPIAPGFAFK